MDNLGKIIFHDDTLTCEITLNIKNQKHYYILEKKDALRLFEQILSLNNTFKIKYQDNNTIIVNLNNYQQINNIINIFSQKNINPKEIKPKVQRKNKYIGKAIVSTSLALALLASGIAIYRQTKNNNIKEITSLPSTSQTTNEIPIKEEPENEVLPQISIIDEPISKEDSSQTIFTEEDDYQINIQQDNQSIEEESVQTNIPQNSKSTEEENEQINIQQNSYSIEENNNNTEYQTDIEIICDTFNINDTDINEGNYEKYNDVVNNYYDLFEKYGNMYGIDPLLLSYIATQERGTHSETKDEGGAIGLCQHQVYWTELNVLTRTDMNIDEKIKAFTITAYNFETGAYDELLPITEYSKEVIDSTKLENKTLINLSDLEDNIRLCAAKLASDLKYFDYDIFTTIIAYNQGRYGTKDYIDMYAIINLLDCDVAQKSKKWIEYIPKDNGDPDYIYHILRYVIASKNDTISCTYLDEFGNISETKLTIEGDNITSTKSITH